MSIPVLQDAELDALTEVCNIGMGHAATALSQLMGKGVSIEVPRLQLLDSAGLGELLDAQEIISLQLQILGNVRGSILILLRQDNARRILELLLGRHSDPSLPLSELEASTLNEVANILASACLNALGTMLKMTLLPSVPTLAVGEAGVVLAQVMAPPGSGSGNAMVMIDTVFSIADSLCGGSIFLMPEPESLRAILSILGTP
ncbi:MAG: chemotaxis protein CheC [Geobacteraceae bacterium GWC2_58_44]|nr:MAG: chemotaxis protein CheC [Geobacteraceae bacterium GWC2_58_44]